MPLKLLSIAFALPLLLAAAPAMAEPKTIADCESIQAADAYNQCLAKFGPVGHVHELSPVPVGSAATAAPAGAAHGRHARTSHGYGRKGHGASRRVVRTRGHGRHGRFAGRHHAATALIQTSQGGRKQMQFSVVPSGTSVQ